MRPGTQDSASPRTLISILFGWKKEHLIQSNATYAICNIRNMNSVMAMPNT